MIQPQSDITIGPEGMTFGRLTRLGQGNLLGKVLNSLLKPLHLPIHDANIRIGHRIGGIIPQRLHKILNGLLKLAHILIATPSVMEEYRIFRIQFNSKRELFTRVLVVLEFVIDDAQGVVDGWEFGVVADEERKALEGGLVVGLALVVEAQVV